MIIPFIAAISVTDCGNGANASSDRYGLEINTTSDLDRNIISNGTCIIINASNVNFSCDGFSITYGNALETAGNQSFGILVLNATNVTISGCNNITDGNASSGRVDIAINISRANHTIILNSTLTSNATINSYGIYATDVYNLSIINTTIYAETGADVPISNGIATAIFIRGGSNITILGNTIKINASENGTAISLNSVNSSLIANNTANINLFTVGLGRGLQLLGTGSRYNVFENNTINLTAIGPRNYGIELSGSFNNVTRSVINATGTTENYGIYVYDVNNVNTFRDNIIRTNGTLGYGVYLNVSNFTIFDNTNFTDVAQWIYLNQSYSNNLTNATFNNSLNGTIKFTGTVSLSGFHVDVTKAKLNISTLAIAYVNTTNLSLFNSTARIQLIGIRFDDPSFIAPEPQISYVDTISPTFTECPTDICTFVSYVRNVFTFDVTQFSSHQAGAATVNRCQVVNRSASLNVSINGSMDTAPCIVLNNTNIDFNCNNFTITGSPANQTIGIMIGIRQQNVTIRNCNITNFTMAIYANNSMYGALIENNTLRNNTLAVHLLGTNYSNIRHNNFTNNTKALFLATSIYNNITNSSYGNNTNNTYVLHLLDALNNTFNQSQSIVTQNDVDLIAGRIIIEDSSRSKIDFNHSDITNITGIRNFFSQVTYPSTGEVRLANTENTTSLNRSARLIFFNAPNANIRPIVDYENDNSYTQCADCQVIGYATGGNYTYDVTHFTSYSYEGLPSGGGSTSGGGGGGGVSLSQTYKLTGSNATFSLKRDDKVTFTTDALYTLSVFDVLTNSVIIRIASPAHSTQSFTLRVNTPQLVDLNNDNVQDVRVTLTAITTRATLLIELLSKGCVESWACEAWGECAHGQKVRECADSNACGTTKLKPLAAQACEGPVVPAEPTTLPPVEAEPVVEAAPAVRELPAAGFWTITNTFYALAIASLIVLGAYWYFSRGKSR